MHSAFVTPIRRLLLPFPFLLSCSVLAQEKAPWISEPPEKWPPIALINQVQYLNGDRYLAPSFSYAGTGFLISTGTDTLAATAKHILWIARNHQTQAVQVNAQLKQWVMRPKGNERDSVVIDQLLNEDSTEVLEGPNSTILERDWLLFSVKHASPRIQPLIPRYSPLTAGEKVYILSCAYEDSVATVHEGRIVRTAGWDILIQRDMRENKGGSSGSPVIDAEGRLVGLLSSAWGDPETQQNVVVAISTQYLRAILTKQNPLNVPRQKVSNLLWLTVVQKGAKRALRQYRQLKKDPTNYLVYNLRSPYGDELEILGQKLMNDNRLKEAITILRYTAQHHPSIFSFNRLAQAYLKEGNRQAAIKWYTASVRLVDKAEENEAVSELKRLQSI